LSAEAQKRCMTVDDLRTALAGLPGDLEVVVRATEERDDGDVFVVAGLQKADVESGCDDDDALILTAEDVIDLPAPHVRLVPPRETVVEMSDELRATINLKRPL